MESEGGAWVQREFLLKWKMVGLLRIIWRLRPETRAEVEAALYHFLMDNDKASSRIIADTKDDPTVVEEAIGVGKSTSSDKEELVGESEGVADIGGLQTRLDEAMLEKIKTEALSGFGPSTQDP